MKKQCILLHQRGPLTQLVHQDRLFATALTENEIGLRFYETRGVIFGKLDQSLPHFNEGKAWVESQGYPTTVREQGGLGVVVDEGVLNVSLIIPTSLTPYSGLYEAYDVMAMLIEKSLESYNHKISYYEVKDSYCPGKYDGVIEGKKFCGLAQKRIKERIIISATILVNLDQTQRGQLMKTFYEMANSNFDPKYPEVNPTSMATLSDLFQKDITCADVVKLMFNTTKTWVQSL